MDEVTKERIESLIARFEDLKQAQKDLITATEQNQTFRIEHMNIRIQEIRAEFVKLKEEAQAFVRSTQIREMVERDTKDFISSKLREIINSAVDNELNRQLLKIQKEDASKKEAYHKEEDDKDITGLKVGIKEVAISAMVFASIVGSFTVSQNFIQQNKDGIAELKVISQKHEQALVDVGKVGVEFIEVKSKLLKVQDDNVELKKQVISLEKRLGEMEILFLRKL